MRLTLLLCLAAASTCLTACPPASPPAESARPFVVMRGMPLNADAYHPPVAALVREGIPQKFGREEWDAVVLTQEVHGHVGIYTILGAKMGVKAREALDAPVHNIHVVSETGHDQPLACMIDGLQVSIKSTLGQSLIEVPELENPGVAATFTYEDRSVRVALTPEYTENIARRIQQAIADHGDLTPAYFDEIQAQSYEVWATFDRNEIFEVEPVS